MSDQYDDYLAIAQAAAYVGVAAATLRRWDAAGTLTAVRRPGSQYRFYRIADLEPFRLEYNTAAKAKDSLLYPSPSPRDQRQSRMTSSA